MLNTRNLYAKKSARARMEPRRKERSLQRPPLLPNSLHSQTEMTPTTAKTGILREKVPAARERKIVTVRGIATATEIVTATTIATMAEIVTVTGTKIEMVTEQDMTEIVRGKTTGSANAAIMITSILGTVSGTNHDILTTTLRSTLPMMSVPGGQRLDIDVVVYVFVS